MSLIVLVFWDGLTLSFYVYRASVRPKGSLAAWIPCGPGLVRGVKPTKSMDPTFSNRIRHIRHVQLYISNHINLSQLSIVKNSPLGEPWGTQRTAEFSRCAGNPSQPDHVASHLRRRPKRRIQHLVPKTSWGSADSISDQSVRQVIVPIALAKCQKHPRQLQPPRIFCTEKCP